ncbi:MAG: prepilin-type N-terminal cleavage/methylation domain-containing protein [Calditrichaeota bacterium]|nr:MAG: prepilin-type N-terminal cleavage/methylation domain-containing protein [Calditrichota bacterium]
MMKTKLKNQIGMSLIEVMIALVITGVITTSIFKLYITQHKNYITQEDITDIQQNARSSIDEISRHIRMAGYELPLGLNAIEAYDTNPDTIVLVYHNSGCDTYLSAPMPQPSSELKCGTDISCFYDGQWVFIYDADSAKGEWFEITHVQSAAFHLQHNTMSLSRRYDANALIFAMSFVKFFIDNTTDPDHPKLMIQVMGDTPQVYAENITDLQFQYVMKNGTTLNAPTVAENIREVQIALSGRSNTPEVDDAGIENYRDRTFSTSVYLRNVGI